MTFQFDAEQQRILHDIQRHLESLCNASSRKTILSFLHKQPHQHGIYIHGPVGRGKTTLMQQMYNTLTVSKKRYHCDTFFAEMHHALQSSSMDALVRGIRKKARVIWIDELQIYDIATAMLLRRLIPALFKQHVIVLMTGNVAPQDFYQGGLNRDQFEGFIPYFCKYFYCAALNGAVDYRLRTKAPNVETGPESRTRFWLASPASTLRMDAIFRSHAPNETPTSFTLPLNQRVWILTKTLPSAVFIDFESLAVHDRAFADYHALTQAFSVIFITDVPIFNQTNRDACRRFMAFVDILYDNKVTVYMSAAAAPSKLYQDPGGKLPFERTASRLAEIL